MTSNEEILQDILAYLKGNASDEQVSKLKDWLAADEANKKTYHDIVKTYYRISNIQHWDQINVFAAKRKVETNIIRKRKFPYWSIAASVILLVGIGLTVLLSDLTKEEQIAEVTVIEPGQKGAELVLSNGETIQLKNTQKLLTEQNGSLLQIDSLKGIVYDDKESKGNEIIYNTIKVARGQEYNLQLADGTKVWLNADSELKYPVQFVGTNRKVFLKGEGYFEVAHDSQKPFVVNSHNQDVRVYGTKFNINAYDKNLMKTVLVEGSVGVKLSRLDEEKKMTPGDLLIADDVEGTMTSQKVDVYPYIAWKDGNFIFRNERLEDIMIRLERWYQVKVFFADHQAREELLVGDMKRYETIDKLLYFIEKGSDVEFEINGDVVVVKSK